MNIDEEDDDLTLENIWASITKHRVKAFKDGDSYFDKLRKIRRYYEGISVEMIEHHATRPHQYYNAYPCDWMQVFSHIEHEAWAVMRSIGFIVMYPQYPVDRFYLDFAAPQYKIGIELDGKNFHNQKRDDARDAILKELGWKIYRIPGKEMIKVPDLFEKRFDYEFEMLAEHHRFAIGTGEGLIYAIRSIYFDYLPDIPTINGFEYDDESCDRIRKKMMAHYRQSLETHTSYNRL